MTRPNIEGTCARCNKSMVLFTDTGTDKCPMCGGKMSIRKEGRCIECKSATRGAKKCNSCKEAVDPGEA